MSITEVFEIPDMNEVPVACSIQVCICSDPNCAGHLIAYDEDDQPIVNIMIDRDRVNFIVMAMDHIEMHRCKN